MAPGNEVISDEEATRLLSSPSAPSGGVISDQEASAMLSGADPRKPVATASSPTSTLLSKYFPTDAIPVMSKIMHAESSGSATAVNSNTNGTQDHGLFQINDVNVPALKKAGIISSRQDLYDPEKNVKAAAFLYKQSGTQPWNPSKSVWGAPGAASGSGWVARTARAVSPYTDVGLPLTGALGGSLVAAPANIIAPGVAEVAGAGLGGAAGEQLAKWIRELGGEKPQGLVPSVVGAGTDIAKWSGTEIGGQAIGAAISPLISTIRKGLPFLEKGAQTRVGKMLDDLMSNLSEKQVANSDKIQGLEEKVGTPPMTPAQRTGSLRSGMVEQGLATNPEFAEQLAARDTTVRETALDRFTKTLGKGKALPGTQTDYQTGQAITGGISKELGAVKQTEAQLWGAIPNYPVPFNNMKGAIKSVSRQIFDKDTESAVNGTVAYMKRMPTTVEGLDAVDKTLSSDIEKYLRAGDRKIARPLIELHKAVKSDIEALGRAASVGDVALLDGKLVYPSALHNAYATAEKRLLDHLGKPDFLQSPVVIDSARKNLADFGESINKLEPAEDVANQIKKAKSFSKEQKFDRFYRGQTQKSLAKGDEYGGAKIAYEDIPKRFFSPSGFRDLTRALGSPAKAAQELRPFVVNNIIKASTDANGEFSVQSGLQFLKKNGEVLRMAGLDRDVKDIIKSQMPREFERMLAAKRVDISSGNPYFTVQETRNLLQKYGGAIKEMYGKESVEAFRDYHDLIQAMSRNKNVSFSGGSTSMEKLVSSPEALNPLGRKMVTRLTNAALSSAGAGAGYLTTHGPLGALAGASIGRGVAEGASVLSEHAAQLTTKLMREAILNPERAAQLVSIARASTDAKGIALAGQMIRGLVLGVSAAADRKKSRPQWKNIGTDQ